MNDNESDMQPEYDLASMGTPVRGKYLDDYKQYVRVIRLSESLATRFPTEESVLEALRVFVSDHPSNSTSR